MTRLQHLLENNRRWADGIRQADADFFPSLAQQQAPRYFWIGCADARVPANDIVGLKPGELFVHRNVANLVVSGDPNGMAALQFAVEVLKVNDVIVCGHYGCGGVGMALRGDTVLGPIDRWLSHLREIKDKHLDELNALSTTEAQWKRLCELNVMSQVEHVAASKIMTRAWANGQNIAVHGWIYGLNDGMVRDLAVSKYGGTEA